MSFHDELAELALRDGNTPEEFRTVAQQHALWVWIFAAIAAAVWYFVGWTWSAIPLVIAILSAVKFVSAMVTARKLEALHSLGHNSPLAAALPQEIDLNDVLQVTIIDDIREKYSSLLADESHPYAGCFYQPASILPYPKETIERALQSLLSFVEGREESVFLDSSLRSPEAAEIIQGSLACLDNFVDIQAESLPTDPQQNLLIGSRLAATHRAARSTS